MEVSKGAAVYLSSKPGKERAAAAQCSVSVEVCNDPSHAVPTTMGAMHRPSLWFATRACASTRTHNALPGCRALQELVAGSLDGGGNEALGNM